MRKPRPTEVNYFVPNGAAINSRNLKTIPVCWFLRTISTFSNEMHQTETTIGRVRVPHKEEFPKSQWYETLEHKEGLCGISSERLWDDLSFSSMVDINFWVERSFLEVSISKSLTSWTHLASYDQINNLGVSLAIGPKQKRPQIFSGQLHWTHPVWIRLLRKRSLRGLNCGTLPSYYTSHLLSLSVSDVNGSLFTF